ncbi:MAG: hypothetical protein ACYTGO_11780 [Planctomycetota bacterium]
MGPEPEPHTDLGSWGSSATVTCVPLLWPVILVALPVRVTTVRPSDELVAV